MAGKIHVEVIMRKQKKTTSKTFRTLLLYAVLACMTCACGAKTDPSDSSASDPAPDSTSEENAPQQIQENDPDTDSAPAENTEQDPEETTAGDNTRNPDAESADPETDTTVSTFPSHIRIEMKSETDEKKADDGTVYCTTSYTYPVIHIEGTENGNDDAITKINADIRSRIDSFLANTAVEEMAKEGYEYSISEESEYPFLGYSQDLMFGVKRADNNVISFTATFYDFTGGAHGNYTTQGINYNARTGDLIAFADLSDDANAFHEDTLAYNQQLAKTEAYQMRMFQDDMLSESLEKTLYTDDTWYLSTSGLTFISDPYLLGPYAAGTIEFSIPYTELSGMGFKKDYAYTDRTIVKLLENETCTYDLNGDGEEDSILFQSENTENADGTYGAVLHLTINDNDFSQNGSDPVREYLTTYAWGELFLYDMNVEDDRTELAVLSWESEGAGGSYYTHFLRYTKEGDLLYLGKAKGDASDPSATISGIE